LALALVVSQIGGGATASGSEVNRVETKHEAAGDEVVGAERALSIADNNALGMEADLSASDSEVNGMEDSDGAASAAGTSADAGQLSLVEQLDFEQDTGGFAAGNAAVTTENGALKVTGSGSGSRSAAKTFTPALDTAEAVFALDWRPEDVSTAANSSELLWVDTDDKPVFRVVKQGGVNGGILYGAGSSGTELSTLTSAIASHQAAEWLRLEVAFDFATEQVTLRIRERDSGQLLADSGPISLLSIDYTPQLKALRTLGNRASGQTLGFVMHLDNYTLHASTDPAPEQQPRTVTEIVTPYAVSHTIGAGASLADVVSILPQTVEIRLSNGALRTGIPLLWQSDDYDGTAAGVYTLTGELDLSGLSQVLNPDAVAAEVTVTVAAAGGAPALPGYETKAYTDFGDQMPLLPAFWGFSTANATLALHTTELAGNATSKLHFNITNQSGGRVATKRFAEPYIGESVVLVLDWYPGKVNNKGSHPNENGGELQITNESNQPILTLNHTNNAPLSYYAGLGSGRATLPITQPEAWYRTTITFDYVEQEIRLHLANEALAVDKTRTLSMAPLVMDTKIGGIRLAGVRTAGNNLTWDTYLDNIALYVAPLPEHAITLVPALPYHRIYVSEASDDLAELGLPEQVSATLADGSVAEVPIAAWEPTEGWDPDTSGVYTFRGTLDIGDSWVNPFDVTALLYVYNRLDPPATPRNTEWLDRGAVALSSDDGIFVSWRLLADEYEAGASFNLYRNGVKLNSAPLLVTNYTDAVGSPGDRYTIETLRGGKATMDGSATAQATDYLSIPLQKPEGGVTATGPYTYHANDASVGDLDGDGEYEIIVKWYPSNAIDSSQSGMTGPTIFDAYKLDGSLLWRMNMGFNLTSGAHYHQFIVADLDGDGRSEMLIKTADATTVYGATDGVYDPTKIISVIGNPEDDGRWVNDAGKVYGGPEYMTVFDGLTGEAIDTVDYAFALGDVASWGDSFHNRSDRFLAGLAYLDGEKPSVVYGRGYYERTTYIAYSLVDGKLVTEWTFDSAVEGRGGGLGFHSLATGDVDNDGRDEIIAGSLVLDDDGTILYMMDGEMGRERGSHGDAMHVGAFDPDREGLHFIGVHEDPAVASLEYHDGATGETIMSFYGSVDAGRGLAANITSRPGYEFWGTAPDDVTRGGGIYNVQGETVADSFRSAGLPVNFALYWDGDLLHELLDNTSITKYNEATGQAELLREFDDVVSNNGTKATPTLQADILGDWREEVILPTTDSSELRIYSTTIPTEYRLYTLMHDTVYRMGIAWQNVAYNQPPHLGYYLGEDVRDIVLAGELPTPAIRYTNAPAPVEPPQPPPYTGGPWWPPVSEPAEEPVSPEPQQPGDADLALTGELEEGTVHAAVTAEQWAALLEARGGAQKGPIVITVSAAEATAPGTLADAYAIELPAAMLQGERGAYEVHIRTSAIALTLPADALHGYDYAAADRIVLHLAVSEAGGERTVQIALVANGEDIRWRNAASPLTVRLPHPLAPDQHPAFLAVWHVDEHGERSILSGGRYDTELAAMVFRTAHLSTFVIDYNYRTFADIAGVDWARHAIEALAAKGIVQGVSASAYAPSASITRADFVTLLVRTLELQPLETGASAAEGAFADVAADRYYYDAVSAAYALGIVEGDGARFYPSQTITRQEMIVMMARALQALDRLPDEAGPTRTAFADREQIAPYAERSVELLVKAGLILGADGRLHPLAPLTRAEAAVLLHRIYEQG